MESLALAQVYEYIGTLNNATKAKKVFKTVNNMLQVLDRDGLYGAVVYLEAYGEDGPGILSRLNLLLNRLAITGEYEENVRDENMAAVKQAYSQSLADDTPASRAAEMVFRRLLIHLRFALKAQDA